MMGNRGHREGGWVVTTGLRYISNALHGPQSGHVVGRHCFGAAEYTTEMGYTRKHQVKAYRLVMYVEYPYK